MEIDTNIGKWLEEMGLNHPLTIAGPCSAESEEQVMETAKQLSVKGSRVTVFRAGVWKPRTRPGSFEGVGEQALPWVKRVKEELGLLTAIEVANTQHVKLALAYDVDILWLGARTVANPFAVQEIADALKDTDKIVLVKNPVNPDLELWIGAFERLSQAGVKRLGAIHRGFSTFDKTEYRNKPHWQIPIDLKARIPNLPIICDPSHICGRRDTIEAVSQQALDLQFDGLMIETHPTPDKALSDAAQQLTPEIFHQIIERLIVRNKTFSDEQNRSKLNMLREEIDLIDESFIELLSKRMEIVEQIGLFKKEQNVAVLQNRRFREIVNKILAKSVATKLSKEVLLTVFQAIHEESIRKQNEIVNGG